MGNAILSQEALADLAASADCRVEESSAPLVLVAEPATQAPSPGTSAGTPNSLSAWAPGNRANPICEVMPPARQWSWLVVALAALTATVIGAAWVLR